MKVKLGLDLIVSLSLIFVGARFWGVLSSEVYLGGELVIFSSEVYIGL